MVELHNIIAQAQATYLTSVEVISYKYGTQLLVFGVRNVQLLVLVVCHNNLYLKCILKPNSN